MLTKDEKRFLKDLVKQELKEFNEDKVERPLAPQVLALEMKYDEFLQGVLKKLG